MEMPEQELPAVFSQMLQLFPNVPQDIIWIYVKRYSSDIEKCAQMLNLQNGKYTGLESGVNNSKNLSEYESVLQASNSKIVLDNNNADCLADSGNQHTEMCNFYDTYSASEVSSNTTHENSTFINSSRNLGASVNSSEPLIIDIVPDDDDISHSWRPNVSADMLCSDLFVPSPMFENFHLNSNQIPSLNLENNSEIRMSSGGIRQESWRYLNNSMHMLSGFPVQGGKDIASYLHYQKSQMNVIRYEVIKAKIELSDLKESIEELNFELKKKMQSKSVQDIEELNKEIVQLRLECQCLCTDVDYVLNDEGLLGEIDERCYEESKSFSNSTKIQSAASEPCTNSHEENNAAVVHDESNRWHCSKCTFANHPAINVCEMCHLPKPGTQRAAFLPAASSSCYCHPKEKSLSVQS